MYILQPQVAQCDKTEALLDILEGQCMCRLFESSSVQYILIYLFLLDISRLSKEIASLCHLCHISRGPRLMCFVNPLFAPGTLRVDQSTISGKNTKLIGKKPLYSCTQMGQNRISTDTIDVCKCNHFLSLECCFATFKKPGAGVSGLRCPFCMMWPIFPLGNEHWMQCRK